MKFSEKVETGPVNKRLNCGVDPDDLLDAWDCFSDLSLLRDTESD